MQHRTMNTSAAVSRRRGFTLVELIIVVAIIGVLIALSVSAFVAMIGSQRKKNTTFTMRELNGSWNKHYTEVIKSASSDKEQIPPAVLLMAAGDAKLARVLYVKFRLKQEFPTSFAEALNPAPLPPKPSYVAYLKGLGIVASAATPAEYESSVCMYLSLTQNRNNTQLNVEQMTSAIQEVAVGNGKAKMFADAWGNPYIFCRWATGDATLDSLEPIANSMLRDPADPLGLLISTSWFGGPSSMQFQSTAYGHSLTKGAGPHAYYLIPVIMSCGPDGKPGIADFTTMTVTAPAQAVDNIYSYNLDRE